MTCPKCGENKLIGSAGEWCCLVCDWEGRLPTGWRLVPIEAPLSLLPLLTDYGSVEHMSERDRNEIERRLRARWAAILAALPTTATLMHEDELPADITDAEYAAWFAQSFIPGGAGCRVGPRFVR